MNEGIERLVDLAATDYRGLVGRRIRLIAVHAAAAVFAALAVASLGAAAAIALAERYGAVTALLMVSAAMLAVALCLVAAAAIMRRSQARIEETQRLNRKMAMVGALSLLTSGTPRKSTALLVAIGAFLALRRMVFGRN